MRYSTFACLAIGAVVWTMTVGSTQAQVGVPSTQVDIPRAVELEREAAVARKDRRGWSRTASLLLEASRFRPENDPVGLVNVRTAAAIYGTMGKLERARSTLLGLADRAITFGEVEVAAHALMDAAHVAAKLRDAPSMLSYYERAQRLAMSSHLTREAHGRITMRLDRSPTQLASSGR
jgi:hypothetical protein